MITLRFSTIVHDFACIAIRAVTWSDYSHVDIVLPEGLLGVQIDGVKIRPFDYCPRAKALYMDAHHMSDGQEKKFYDFARAQINKPYDFGAVFGDLIHHDWRNPNKWYCSELPFAAAVYANAPFLNESEVDRVTPGLLMLSPYLEEHSIHQVLERSLLAR